MRSVTIRIPATIAREITPNGYSCTRGGFYKRRQLQAELKEVTMQVMQAYCLADKIDLPWQLDYTVAWGRNRKAMDDDNIKASLKYVQDGIAERSGVNDKHMTIGTVDQIRDPDKVGYIEVTIRSTGAKP